MDSTSFTILSSLITGVLAIACTKGVDALIKWQKQKSSECSLDDDRADKSYQVVIAEFRQRIAALEAEVILIRKAWGDEVRGLQQAWNEEKRASDREHQECIRNHERLLAKVEMLERMQKSE